MMMMMMMRHRFRFVALRWLFVVWFLLTGASPLEIYVSPEGDDGNAGTSSSLPLRTLGAAGDAFALMGESASASSLSLFLRRNATFVNDPLNIVTRSGNVIVGSYGDERLPRPLIQHARGINNDAVACVKLEGNITNVRVSDLHVSGCSKGVVLDATVASFNISVERNVFQDIRTPFFRYTPPNPKWAPAISMTGAALASVTVSNNIAARIDVFFSSTTHITGMNLDSNTVQQCSGNCYALGQGVGIVMQNSVLLQDNSLRLFMYGTTDVIVGGLTGDNKVINNDFNQRGEYPGGPDGCAFDFETAATGFLVSGNSFS